MSQRWKQNFCSHITESLVTWPPSSQEGWEMQSLSGHPSPGLAADLPWERNGVWGQQWSLPQWGSAQPFCGYCLLEEEMVNNGRQTQPHSQLFLFIGTQPCLFMCIVSMANFTLHFTMRQRPHGPKLKMFTIWSFLEKSLLTPVLERVLNCPQE